MYHDGGRGLRSCTCTVVPSHSHIPQSPLHDMNDPLIYRSLPYIQTKNRSFPQHCPSITLPLAHAFVFALQQEQPPGRMPQHQSQEDDSPPIPLRRELDLETAELLSIALTSLRGYSVQITNEVRASTRIMRENNARLTMIQYFTIALLMFVIAFDLVKFMAIP